MRIPSGKVAKAKNIPVTPGSMNSLFSDFFRKFEGVILEVFGSIFGVFGRDCGRKIGVKPGEKTPPK